MYSLLQAWLAFKKKHEGVSLRVESFHIVFCSDVAMKSLYMSRLVVLLENILPFFVSGSLETSTPHALYIYSNSTA